MQCWLEWAGLLKRIFRFPVRLINNGPLLFYFIIVVCMLGALGAWIPAAQIWFGNKTLMLSNIHRNLATYIVSIAITAFADCMVRRKDEDDKTFQLLLLGLTLAVVACSLVVLLIDTEETIIRYSIYGTITAAIIWLMVNDSNPALTKPTDAFSPIGGQMPTN